MHVYMLIYTVLKQLVLLSHICYAESMIIYLMTHHYILTEAEDIKKGGKNTQKNYTKMIFMTQISMKV